MDFKQLVFKKNGIREGDKKKDGMRDFREKGTGMRDQGPLSSPHPPSRTCPYCPLWIPRQQIECLFLTNFVAVHSYFVLLRG